MSELLAAQTNNRLQLLCSVSALSLLFAVSTNAKAQDVSRPTVWVELGGQLSRLENKQELYSPPFLALEPTQFDSPLPSMRPTGYGMEANGAMSLQPEGSNWIFSAAGRYGRSSNSNNFHQQSYPAPFLAKRAGGALAAVPPLAAQAIDAKSTNQESHAVLDFLVGRDVGVGLFGRDSSSFLNFGVRLAQFQSRSKASLNEDPDWHFETKYQGVLQVVHQPYHTYAGVFEAERSFHGIGPALAWKSSMPFGGDTEDRALTFDWGVNASLLFGRQRTRTEHHTSAQFHPAGHSLADAPGRNPVYHHPTDAPAYYSTRSRSVTVPNVGGFAGLSFRYSAAKISLGYRADFFFGAMDGGIDTRKTYDRNFYGPFASVSIGLGG